MTSCIRRGLPMAALWLALALPALAAPPGGETVKSVDQFQAGRDAFADPEKMPGAPLYQENCAGCHQGGVYKAPHRTWLEMMTPSMLFSAMNDGMMQAQAAHLSREQRQQIAEYLSRQKLDSAAADPMPPRCEGAAARFDMDRPPAPVGWGHDTSRFVPAANAGLTAADVPKLRLKWAFAFPNAMRARSQPAIGLGAVFVGSKDGTIYAFDLDTGCVRWTYQAKAEVRTAIVLDNWTKGQAPARPLLYFGDVLARAYALDMRTGAEVWITKVDDHSSATITGSPALHAGRLYVPVSSLEVTAPADPSYPCCTFRGAVAALDAATGQPVWKSHTIPDEPTEQGRTSVGTPILGPSGAPVWNSPAVDAARGLLYVGSGENYASPADGNSDALMAFDLKTGQRRWLRQTVANDAWNVACMMGDHPSCPKERGPDLDYAASPILAALPGGGQMLLGGQKSGVVHGVDPDTGALRWSTRVGRGGVQGGVHFGMAAEGARLYVPIYDMANARDGSKPTDPPRPGLYAIDAATGKLLWSHPAEDVCGGREFCDPGITAAITAMPGVVFAGHSDGWVRAYDGATGKIVWRFDTTQPVKAVNGVEARGGSMSGPGPAIGDGHVVLNSGYGLYFKMPGNALLVFAPEKGR